MSLQTVQLPSWRFERSDKHLIANQATRTKCGRFARRDIRRRSITGQEETRDVCVACFLISALGGP